MANKDTYQVLFRGFDCLVSPKEEGTFDVSVFEGGAHVFTTNITMDLTQFEDDDELDDNSEALIDEAAQAAVDQYESERGTLGQGAGATQKASKMEKKAYSVTMNFEDWFLNLKGTPVESQAVGLLEQYVTLVHDTAVNPNQGQINELTKQLGQLEYELDMLNIKRMQQARANETVIVIRGYKEACGVSALVDDFVERFRGHANEGVVLKKIKECMDIEAQLTALHNDESWKKLDELQRAMDELLVTALQQEVDNSVIDQGGMNLAPNMAADVAELMEGVSFDTPIEPQHELPAGLFAKRKAQDLYEDPEESREDIYSEALDLAKTMKKSKPQQIHQTLMFVYGLNEDEANDILAMLDGSRSAPERMIAKKRAQESQKFSVGDKVVVWPDDSDISWNGTITQEKGWDDYKGSYSYKVKNDETENMKEVPEGSLKKVADKAEDKPGDEHPLEELGEIADGKDIAEVPMDDMPFQIGDSVTLTKAYELALWGGATDELPKGMKGTIKNLYDGHGDYYMVECEEGGVYRIPTEYLK
jgi:DNA-binding transcriptional MerR regulator